MDMKDVLLNFLLVFSPLLIIQLLYMRKETNKKMNKWLFALLPALAVILSMLYPFKIEDEFFFDFRRIPLVMGLLYGGYPLGIFLFAVTTTTRVIIGGNGIITTVVMAGLLVLFVPMLSSYYLKSRLRKKLILAVSIVLLSMLLTIIQIDLSYGLSFHSEFYIELFVLHLIATVIGTVLFETIVQNFNLLKRIIKAEKLEVVSHLAASISHEVRNPLTTTKGFLQLLRDDDISQEKKEEYIEISLNELDRATNIIKDYLTFARPEAENNDPIDVHSELKNCLNVMSPLAQMENVQLIEHFCSDDILVLGDPLKLKQSLINLIKNGIESHSAGGTLEVKTTKGLTHVKIIISDQGKGMSEEQVIRLGEPYFSTKTNGTGLGMMVSYSIIEAMKGTIHVKSKPDSGTSFTIFLPIYQSNEG
ncbi:ATP-binding protein [Metabacillus idriensis]|uniref:ATP-binding protein n=1 Tax=Metabacillus idriensis TaxID=324768 RepID=UPI00296719B9|nr:ATP-binding protein [Metabacillus idriensis]